MKLKSLLFGSAAVLAAGTGAQAADLPAVEPVEYVRICDVFGTGFFYIPGTDTCLKLAGYVRVESHFVTGDPADLTARFGVPASEVDNWTTRVRGVVSWDVRTQTDIGLVRAYIALQGQRGPGQGYTGDLLDPEETAYPVEFDLASAFIQVSNDWGTYTAGKFGSFFDFWGGYSYGTRIGIEAGTDDPNLFAWTFAGGNGFSFSIAAEDPKSIGRRRDGDDDYEGQEAPDGVANIRVDQGWGSAQVMGAVRHINDVNGDGIGWAVGAGLKLGVPGGWEISSQGGYSEGAVSYISSDIGGLGDFDGPTGDDTNESWSVRAGITGPLISPNFKVWAEGAFIYVEEDGGEDDYEFYAAAVGGAWSPVPGLSFGPEFAWNRLDATDTAVADETDDYDIWGVMWRLERGF
jgi:hypothetical protein